MARFDLQDFKKQASFFLREKLNDARLALTDVSRIQLLTEEATNEDEWGPETRIMAMLADAAFELDEYERIVQVIHRRIDRGCIIWEKADRVLELLNNPDLRKEERTRARKISFGIRGFGSSVNQEPPQDTVEDTEHQSWRADSKELSVSSNKSFEEIGNAGSETPKLGQKCVPYEKSVSMMSRQLTQAVSCNSSSKESVLATLEPLEGKGQMKLFKKSLSSPGYFRESLPRLSWQTADDVINELEEVNTCLLDAAEERESPILS